MIDFMVFYTSLKPAEGSQGPTTWERSGRCPDTELCWMLVPRTYGWICTFSW